MKHKLIILLILLISSCTFSSNLSEFNDENFIMINEDNYIDLVERYGEPSSVIFRHVDFKVTAVAKFEELRNYEIVYISFSHINSNLLVRNRWKNKENEFEVANGAYRQDPKSNHIKSSELKYYKDSERSFQNNPELWIARSYDIRPLKFNDSGPAPFKRESGIFYILIAVGLYIFI